MSMLEAALTYARKGAPVFPCNPDKSPLTSRGFKDATTDEKQIKEWWEKNPDALIGIPTGEVSGIDTLDFDTYKEGGQEAYDKFIADHNVDGHIVVRTGRGGLQYWFRSSGNFPSSAGRLAKNIDTRGEGGYTIVPPSVSQFGPYEFIKHGKLLDKPESVEALAISLASKKERGKKAVDLINEGARNSDATRIAGSLRSFGLSTDHIERALAPITTLDSDEVRTIAESVGKYTPEILEEKTEAGQASYFARLYGGRVRFNWSNKRWMVWREHWWEEDKGGKVRSYILTAYKLRLKNAELAWKEYRDSAPAGLSTGELTKWLKENDVEGRGAELAFAKAMGSNHAIEAVWEIARTLLGSKKIEWDTDPNLIGVKNGVVDLRTGELSNGVPEQMISLHIDIDYAIDAVCPRWERFASEVMGDNPDWVKAWQNSLGYSLTGLTREQIWFLCYGGGSNGKSTALEDILLKYVLGPYGAVASIETFTVRRNRSAISHDVADLEGKRFVVTMEPGAEVITLDEERMKSITTGGRVRADKKHQDAKEFSPVLKLWLEANELPRVKDMTEGFWRRVCYVPFLVHFEWPEKIGSLCPRCGKSRDQHKVIDKEIVAQLTAEIPGILRWIVEGAISYYKDGLPIPPDWRTRAEEYREDQDIFGQMIADAFEDSGGDEIPSDDLHPAYVKWCRNHGIDHPLTQPTFIAQLKSRLPNAYHRSSKKRYWDIRPRKNFESGPAY